MSPIAGSTQKTRNRSIGDGIVDQCGALDAADPNQADNDGAGNEHSRPRDTGGDADADEHARADDGAQAMSTAPGTPGSRLSRAAYSIMDASLMGRKGRYPAGGDPRGRPSCAGIHADG